MTKNNSEWMVKHNKNKDIQILFLKIFFALKKDDLDVFASEWVKIGYQAPTCKLTIQFSLYKAKRKMKLFV